MSEPLKYFLPTLLFLGFARTGSGQVVTLVPALATQDDTVTVIFDATQGNGQLTGVAQVYTHTGVITNLSTSATDWRHVQGNWGTDDPKVKMTALGNNLHEIKYHIPTYYNLPAGETVEKLAFVFRNVDGSQEGKNADGSDIFVDIYAPGFNAAFTQPNQEFLIRAATDQVQLEGDASMSANMDISVNGSSIASGTGVTTLSHLLDLSIYPAGELEVVLTATNGSQTETDTLHILSRGSTPVAAVPSYGEEGILYPGDSSVYFQLRAPFKNYVYLIGDFNNWRPHPDYELSRTPDGQYFWIELNGLDPEQEYRFQYWVDDEALRMADPYSTKVLDPWNDGYISSSTYPNLIPYPAGKTNFPVGVIRIAGDGYEWDTTITYQRPPADNLVIYELLIRDFDEDHTFAALINRLDYLDSLGVNAVELMPVMEFEGNESWGYNTMFLLAPDKYYGPSTELKRLVEECHRRGIAVVLDIAMNHAFGQSPLVRLYWDSGTNQPAANSPWFNQVAKHDFNVGYDFNHESAATKYYTKKVFRHWIEEYRIDGYRMDLSKGFTQVNTLGNTAAWGAYDASRIAIWQEYGDDIWALDPEAYIILEHFANNDEEIELSSRGFMLWGNMNHEYNEATMAYSSNLTGISAQGRGWAEPRLVGFAESHDEERLMYRNGLYGNSNGSYNTREVDTALQRMAMAAALLYTVPGPKMLWQFGELGYDYSINHCPDGTVDPGCRTSNKPIRWDYAEEPERAELFRTVAELIRLKTTYPVFREGTATLTLSGLAKQIVLDHADMDVVVTANTNLIPMTIAHNFTQTGRWYDHFNRDSLEVAATPMDLSLQPGEFRLFTTEKLWTEVQDTTPEPEPAPENIYANAYPNPFRNLITIEYGLDVPGPVDIEIHDMLGRLVWSAGYREQEAGVYRLPWNGLTESGEKVMNGIYVVAIRTRSETKILRISKVYK